MLKLNWDKRYITLAAVSTILGLWLFRLKDSRKPARKRHRSRHHLRAHPDSDAGSYANRKAMIHWRTPFFNCPTKVKTSSWAYAIIGGAPMAGKGWEMLMACLAAGRRHLAARAVHRCRAFRRTNRRSLRHGSQNSLACRSGVSRAL